MAAIELNIKPYTGMEMDAKVGLLAHFKFIFDQLYPFRPPRVTCSNSKGIDTEQLHEIIDKINIE